MMLYKITSIKGNINKDEELRNTFTQAKKPDILELSREEMKKTRMRKKTTQGADLGIVLHIPRLHDGDVLESDRFIVVKQTKELVLCLSLNNKLKDTNSHMRMLIFLGHVIGNRHRPISINNNKIYFPIHDKSEIETFRKLFQKYLGNINLKIEEIVFNPIEEMNTHEH